MVFVEPTTVLIRQLVVGGYKDSKTYVFYNNLFLFSEGKSSQQFGRVIENG